MCKKKGKTGNGIKGKKAGNGGTVKVDPKPIPTGLGAIHVTAIGIWAAGECILRFSA